MNDKTNANVIAGYENARTIYYMCKTDYDYELPNCQTSVFPTIRELKEKLNCVKECGIVEVEIRLLRIIEQQNFPNCD
jgi:hypothetical protein